MPSSDIIRPFKITASPVANQFVTSITANGIATLAQPAVANLSDGSTGSGAVALAGSPTFTGTVALPIVTIAGLLTNYNGVNTVGNGIPQLIYKVDTTGLTANVGSTNFTTNALGGWYRMSGYAVITTAATTGAVTSTLPNITYSWHDNETGVSTSHNLTPSSAANVVGTNSTGVAATPVGSVVFYQQAGTAFGYATANYASNTAAQMVYSIHILVEYLGA